MLSYLLMAQKVLSKSSHRVRREVISSQGVEKLITEIRAAGARLMTSMDKACFLPRTLSAWQ